MKSVNRNWIGAALMVCAVIVLPQARSMELREALGHFESGATTWTRSAADAKIGSRKEVSRFQILPSVWNHYSTSKDFRNPDVAWSVAEKILAERRNHFVRATGREWDPMDLYIMWNAPGVYERVKWDRSRVSPVVLERAQRFANLMGRKEQLVAYAQPR
jgi:hypothetical protein